MTSLHAHAGHRESADFKVTGHANRRRRALSGFTQPTLHCAVCVVLCFNILSGARSPDGMRIYERHDVVCLVLAQPKLSGGHALSVNPISDSRLPDKYEEP